MALIDNGNQRSNEEARRIEALASALDLSIAIYDRNDTLIAASSQFLGFFPIDPALLQPGARLRDLFSATYDAGARGLGTLDGKQRHVSREDWIAERIAIHWRERYESIEKLPDGRWLRLCKRRMPDGILIATIQDITEQKRRDDELAATIRKGELVQTILDNLANPVIVKDSQLRYLMVNDAFCRIPGMHRKQILGKKAADLMPWELAAAYEKNERRVLETGIPYQAVEQIYRSDGSAMNVITHMRRTGTPDDYCVTVSFDDISAITADIPVAPGTDLSNPAQPKEVPHSGAMAAGPARRALVVDEDIQRAADCVGRLKAEGYDVVATASASEALLLVEIAQSMNLPIKEIEVSEKQASILCGMIKSPRHDLLRQALDRKAMIQRTSGSDSLRPEVLSARPASAVAPVASISKPLKCGHEAANAGKIASGTGSVNRDPADGRLRILVAEDNQVNQIVFEQILEGIGVDYRIVDNGREAVAAWSAAAPDLVLMDVSMPFMNGLQATQAIRDAEAKLPDGPVRVPIIAVTAHAMTGDRERCLAAGMDDYLSKPVSPEKLENIIEKWVTGPKRIHVAG